MLKNLNPMDTKVEVTPEEQKFEQEAIADINEDEIRAKIVEEFGFDEASDAEKIDKLVAKDVEGRKKLSKAIGQKKAWRDQFQKNSKDNKPPVDKSKDSDASKDDLSQKDVLVLAKADLHEDDLEEVIEFAKFKKMTIAEALKNSTLKSILSEKAEFRKSAEAANSGASRRTTTKLTPQQIVSEASKGNVPEKGSREAEELFWAKRGGRPKDL